MDIAVILKGRGLTKSELASRLGIANQNINKTFNNPTEATIRRIAEALGVPVWQLFVEPGTVITEATSEEVLCERIVCPDCGAQLTIRVTREAKPD